MQELTTLITNYGAELWSVALVLLGAIITRIARLRPKLIYSIGHASTLLHDLEVKNEEGGTATQRAVVYTAHITVQNTGLQPAKALEVTFNYKPPVLNVWPARSYTVSVSSFDRHSLRFDSIAPGEQINVEIMSFHQDLPMLTSVRADECVAQERKMTLQRAYSNWFNVSALIIFILGLYTIAKFLVDVTTLVVT